MWHTAVLVVHVAIALLLIGLVLLQRGKGAEAGTGFGAGASGTVFGARGSANFLSRSTAILATLFFATCLVLVYLSTQAQPEQSLIERSAERMTPSQSVAPPPRVDDELEIPEGPPSGAAAPPERTPAAGSSDAAGEAADAGESGAAASGGEGAADSGAPAGDGNP